MKSFHDPAPAYSFIFCSSPSLLELYAQAIPKSWLFSRIYYSFTSWYNGVRLMTAMFYPSLSTMCLCSSFHQEMESIRPLLDSGLASWLVPAGGMYLKYVCDSSEPRPIGLPYVFRLPLGSLSLPSEQVWPSLVYNERPSWAVLSHPSQDQLCHLALSWHVSWPQNCEPARPRSAKPHSYQQNGFPHL